MITHLKSTLFLTMLMAHSLLISCSDETENPIDINDPNYEKTTISILTSSDTPPKNCPFVNVTCGQSWSGDTMTITNRDSFEIRIKSNHIDRINNYRIDYDLDRTTDTAIIKNLQDITFSYTLNKADLLVYKKYQKIGMYRLEVYAYSKNGDDCADTMVVVVDSIQQN